MTTIAPAGAQYSGDTVRLDVCELTAGTDARVVAPDGDEVVVVLLSGEVQWLGVDARRASVFGERASAVYLPPGTMLDVHALTTSEVAIASSHDGTLVAAPGAAPIVVTPSDVAVHERGKRGWQRAVHDVVADPLPAQRLIVGETFNEPGQWSSFPPHKHDGRDGEPALEEVYYYRFDPESGFGFQGLYDADGNEHAVFLRDRSVVGIPDGFHPVCAAPGYRLYYLWALAPRAGAPRRLAMYEDPAHRWLHGAPDA